MGRTLLLYLGDVLYKEGDEGQTFFLLKSGQVMLTKSIDISKNESINAATIQKKLNDCNERNDSELQNANALWKHQALK